jgi:chromosome segregation ATPase
MAKNMDNDEALNDEEPTAELPVLSDASAKEARAEVVDLAKQERKSPKSARRRPPAPIDEERSGESARNADTFVTDEPEVLAERLKQTVQDYLDQGEKLEAAMSQLSAAEADAREARQALESTQNELKERSDALAEHSEALGKKSSEIDELQARIATLEQAAKESDVSLADATSALEERTSALESTEATLAALQLDLGKQQEMTAAREVEITELEQEQAALRSDVDKHLDGIRELEALTGALNERISESETAQQATAAQLQENDGILEELRAQLETVREERDTARAEATSNSRSLEVSTEATQRERETVEELRSRLHDAKTRNTSLESQVQDLSLHIDTQRQQIDEYAAVAERIKDFMVQNDTFRGYIANRTIWWSGMEAKVHTQSSQIRELRTKLRTNEKNLRRALKTARVEADKAEGLRTLLLEASESARNSERLLERYTKGPSIEDLEATIAALEAQLSELKAGMAEADQALKDKASELSTSDQQLAEAAERIEELESTLATREDDIAAQAAELLQLQDAAKTADKQLEAANAMLEAKQTEPTTHEDVVMARSEPSDAVTKIEKLEARLEIRDKSLDRQTELLQARAETIKELEQRLSEAEKALEASPAEPGPTKKRIEPDAIDEEISTELESAREALEKQEQQITDLNAVVTEQKSEIRRKERDLSKAKRALEKSDKKIAKLHSTLAEQEDSLATQSQRITDLEDRARQAAQGDIQSELNGLHDKLTAVEKDLQEARDALRKSEAERAAATAPSSSGEADVDQANQRIAELESMLAAMESGDRGVITDNRHQTPDFATTESFEHEEKLRDDSLLDAASDAPTLVCFTEDKPTRYELTQRVVTIGRSTDCDIQILTHYVSREHARIYNRKGVITIEDLGSKNGIFVNSVRVESQILSHGDWLTIGETQFRFSDPGAS